MKDLIVTIESYLRLIAHDIFMARHDIAALHRQIKEYPLRVIDPQGSAKEPLCRCLDIACVFYPKRALCLQRSAVLVRMLRRRGLPAHLVIGAQKLPFKAHAWVEIDGRIIDDRLAEREKFHILEVC
jgi:hypothetical protein